MSTSQTPTSSQILRVAFAYAPEDGYVYVHVNEPQAGIPRFQQDFFEGALTLRINDHYAEIQMRVSSKDFSAVQHTLGPQFLESDLESVQVPILPSSGTSFPVCFAKASINDVPCLILSNAEIGGRGRLHLAGNPIGNLSRVSWRTHNHGVSLGSLTHHPEVAFIAINLYQSS